MPTSRHIPEANPELPPRRAIASIKVGKRYRRDFGDIAEFARRIASVGLLQPVVITPGGQLIDGLLRLEALKKLGHTHVPVHVVDIDAIVYGELAANVDRKNFTPSELVAITEAIEKRERELARQRMTLGKLSTGSEPGKARDKIDKIAKPHGMSGRTLEKARAVVQAAKTEPEKYNKFVADMDRTGRVNGPYRRLKNAQQAEQLRAAPPPLPGRGPYYGSIIDNPWAYEPDDEDAPYRGVLPYPTMSIEQICSLDIGSIMHASSVIFLWVTNFILVHGLHLPVLRAWGFTPKTLITWPKDRGGQGHWLKGQSEHAVLAVRGDPIVTLTDQTTILPGPYQLVSKNAHSVKPTAIYSFMERLVPAPRYADIFSRYKHNDRWDCFGNEAPGKDDLTTTISAPSGKDTLIDRISAASDEVSRP